MKKIQIQRNYFIILLWLFSSFVYQSQAIIYSNADGDWNNSTTWLRNGLPSVPVCGDTIYIQVKDTVSVSSQMDYSGCASRMFIKIYGSLQFTNGNKLQLPCNSNVTIEVGGLVKKSTPGGGNSTLIEICGTVVWKAGDGDKWGYISWGGSPLPITLLSFEAVPKNKQVDISWTTASEINNDYFMVEKTTDLEKYFTVAKLKGSGNSNAVKIYSCVDYFPFEGVSYYRLKQTDYDGRFIYSPFVAVNFSEKKFGIVNTFVSADDVLNLFFCAEQNKNCSLVINDLLGNILFQCALETETGMNKAEISIEKFRSGIYFVTLSNEVEKVTRKFVK